VGAGASLRVEPLFCLAFWILFSNGKVSRKNKKERILFFE